MTQVTRREPYDESCDIFALGCLLYDLWTRQLRYVALFEHAAHANVLGQYAARVLQTPDCHAGTTAIPPMTNGYMNACPCMCFVTGCLTLLLLSDICLFAGAEFCF